jgi:hypothetical protein
MDAVLYGVLLVWAWKSIRLPAEEAMPTAFVTGSPPIHGGD